MKDKLLEDVRKLCDFNINVIPNKTLEEYYQSWVDEIENENIINPKLITWIKNQINYWGEKDREYARFLEKLIKE